jgi:hypothetical protein
MKQKARWFGLLLLVLAGIFFWQSISVFVAADACLDAGASYNYVAHTCDPTASHPPDREFRAWSAWLGMVLAAAGLWALLRSRKA